MTEQIGGPGNPGNGATSSADHQDPWLWLWPPLEAWGGFPVAPLLPYVAWLPVEAILISGRLSSRFGRVPAGRRATALRLAGDFNQASAVRISLGVLPVQRLNACVNALTS